LVCFCIISLLQRSYVALTNSVFFDRWAKRIDEDGGPEHKRLWTDFQCARIAGLCCRMSHAGRTKLWNLSKAYPEAQVGVPVAARSKMV